MRSIISILLCLGGIASAQEMKVEELYSKHCSGCHGAKFEGGVGGSLVDGQWKRGSSDAEMEPVDVAGLLALMRKEVLARRDQPARFELRLDSDALLLGAEPELHSIFQNLITNAVKYTPASGTVTVRYWTDGAGSHVAVSDTGIGIPVAHIPRLTERFYRVDAGRSRKLGGSGLGLAIVKHALQRHGAQLEITSEEGKGSTFTCHFPAVRVQLRASSVAGVAELR